MKTITLYFLLVFLFTSNEASKEILENICNLKKDTMVIIMKFLTLQEALGLRFASKLLENSIPEVNKKNIKYFKPFFHHGYDENIGFVVSKYCSTLTHDAKELHIINKNIQLLKEREIYRNSCVFALDLKNLLVLFGGIGEYEETIPTKILENVYQVKKSNKAICIRLENNSVEAWGNPMFGGKIPETMKPLLNDIYIIENTEGAFAALSYDHKVFTWGDPLFGGEIPEDTQLQNIDEVVSTKKAFSVCTNDSKVFAWGDPNYGGKVPENIQSFDIGLVISTKGAFAAWTWDGKVFAWGDLNYGGNVPEDIQPLLENIGDIQSTKGAFTARRNDGNVFAWGDPNYGGNVPENIQALQNIRRIQATKGAFSALTNDGIVYAWGDQNLGGNPSEKIKSQLYNVECLDKIYHEDKFEVIFDDGRDKLVWP